MRIRYANWSANVSSGPTTRLGGKKDPRLPWIIAWLDTSGIQSHAAQTAGVTKGTHRAIQKAASWKKRKNKIVGWETEKQWGPSFSNVYLIWFHHALIWVNHPTEEVSRELGNGLRTLLTENAATPPPPLLQGSKLPRRLCRDTERGRTAAQAHMRDSIKQSKNRWAENCWCFRNLHMLLERMRGRPSCVSCHMKWP